MWAGYCRLLIGMWQSDTLGNSQTTPVLKPSIILWTGNRSTFCGIIEKLIGNNLLKTLSDFWLTEKSA